MSPPNRRYYVMRPLVALTAIILAAAGCFIVQRIAVNPVATSSTDSVRVKSSVKAHLLDGSTVVFTDGASVTRDAINGYGLRYALLENERSIAVNDVALDSVVGMETFERKQLKSQSALVSTAATAASAVGLLEFLVSIIRSCRNC